MLPHALSSHICSLVPNEDRLAMVTAMTVEAGGKVKDVEVMAAVIHSQRRLTYEQAAAVLDGDETLPKPVRQRIVALREVADRLRAARMRDGSSNSICRRRASSSTKTIRSACGRSLGRGRPKPWPVPTT